MRFACSVSKVLLLASTQFVICYPSNNLQGDSKYWTKIPKIVTNSWAIQFFFCFTIFWDFNLMVSQSSCSSSWTGRYPTGSWVWDPGDLVTTIMGHHKANNTPGQTAGVMVTRIQTMVWRISRKGLLCPTIPIPTIPPSVSITTITTITQTEMTTSISMSTNINISNTTRMSMCMFTSINTSINMTTSTNIRPQWSMVMTITMLTNIFMNIATSFPSQSGEESITRSNFHEIYVS